MRVNRVTVNVGTEHGDCTIITLYRTNTKLAEITSNKLEIPDFVTSGVDKNTYQSYCKEVIINLLENEGVEGFHWEPKQVTSDTTEVITRKFSSSTFRAEAISRVKEILGVMLDGTDVSYNIIEYRNDDVDVKERYKDMNIKFGSTNIVLDLDKLGNTIKITITVELRSGQMCKPKTFQLSDGSEHHLNVTTITRMFK